MKHLTSFRSWTLAISLLLFASLTALQAQAQATNYWDINGSIPGAGGPTPNGNWEDPTWSTDPTGSIPTGSWTEGNVPVFSAGTDAIGAYTITANNNHTIAGMQAPSGTVTVSGAGILSITNGMQEFAGTNLTLETTLGGSGGFESEAGNNVYLYGNNTYSGGTSLNGGSTYLNSASSLGTGAVSPILGGASPTFSALYSTLNTITLTNNFTINTSNAGIVFVPGTTTPLTLSGDFNLQQDFNCRNNGPGSSANPGLVTGILTLSGNISGPGGMILSCNGDNNSTIALYGANTYTGRTTVDTNGGTRTFINFNTAQPIGSGIPNSLGEPPDAATGLINLGHPANATTGFADALRYTGSTDSTTDRTINNANGDPAPGNMWLFAEGAGAITYSGNITAASSTTTRTLTIQGSSTALNTISGTISDGTGGGVINVTKESPSTWRLLGTNTFTGALTVQNTTGLGGTSTLILGGSNVYAGTTAISANSVLQLGGANAVPHGPGHGSFTIAANGKFELAGYSCSIDGGGGAGMIDNNTGNATLIIDNNGVNQGPIFSGPIQDSGSGVLNFIVNCGGDCQVTSSTGNPYHGYTEVNNGILQFTNDNHLGVVPATLVTNSIIIDSALGWNGTSNSANYYFRLQGASTINLNANRGIYLGNTNGYGGGIGAQSSATLNVNGPITGPGALFSGGGTPHAATGIVVLFGANTYSGPTYVVGGTLRLGANNVLPFGTPLTISDSQSVTFAMNNKSQTIGPLTGVNNFANVNLNGALTIRETSPTTFAGVISQAGGSLILDSNSTSALTLTGTNTYTGTTVINGGTLALSANGSIAASSSLTIGGKGTFSVAGLNTSLTLSNTQTLNIGGTGGFPATIATAAGKGLTLGATGPLNFTAYDGSTVPLTLSGAGSMTLSAGNLVTVTVSGSPLAAASYKLISKGASGSVTGTAPIPLTIAGAGTVAGTANSLSISNAELYLNVVGSLSPVTHMSIASAGGGNLSISYSGGTGSKFVLLQSTNVAAPLLTWAKVQTNTASSGTFTIGTSTNPAAFYKIQSQ